MADLEALLAEQAKLIKELTQRNEELEREKLLNFDPRLRFFGRGVKGSHSYRSASNNSNNNRILRTTTKDAKEKAKQSFIIDGILSCVVCGSTESVSVAHIVSSALSDYTEFGVKNNYIDEIDVFSVRNFMPLCGTEGADGTCHDAIDKHQIHISYDTFQKSYHLSCSPGAAVRFQSMNNRKLKTPPGWNPYRRLLAWRSRKCGTECGFIPNFKVFEAMNLISEESNSVGDVESDDEVTLSTDAKSDAKVESDTSNINRYPEEVPHKKRKNIDMKQESLESKNCNKKSNMNIPSKKMRSIQNKSDVIIIDASV